MSNRVKPWRANRRRDDFEDEVMEHGKKIVPLSAGSRDKFIQPKCDQYPKKRNRPSWDDED